MTFRSYRNVLINNLRARRCEVTGQSALGILFSTRQSSLHFRPQRFLALSVSAEGFGGRIQDRSWRMHDSGDGLLPVAVTYIDACDGTSRDAWRGPRGVDEAYTCGSRISVLQFKGFWNVLGGNEGNPWAEMLLSGYP